MMITLDNVTISDSDATSQSLPFHMALKQASLYQQAGFYDYQMNIVSSLGSY